MNYNLTPCREAAEKAASKPRYCYDAIMCGFCFSITFRPDIKAFEACMKTTRRYAGCKYCYGDTIDELMGAIETATADAMLIYKNGGDYAEKYTYKVSVSAEGYEDTTFEEYHTAKDWYNKLLCMGLNPHFEEIPVNRNM